MDFNKTLERLWAEIKIARWRRELPENNFTAVVAYVSADFMREAAQNAHEQPAALEIVRKQTYMGVPLHIVSYVPGAQHERHPDVLVHLVADPNGEFNAVCVGGPLDGQRLLLEKGQSFFEALINASMPPVIEASSEDETTLEVEIATYGVVTRVGGIAVLEPVEADA